MFIGVLMINKKFHMLTVVASAPKTDKNLKWECLCECGETTVVRGSALRNGTTKSCGCLHSTRLTTHGGKGTRLYDIWSNLRRRCYDPNCKDYKNYGGRGISYPPAWDNFQVFKDWAESTGYDETLTIERIDVNKSYSEDNCLWDTWNVQASNKRKEVNKTSKFLGVSKRNKKWEASVKWLGENYYLGLYADEHSAALNRDAFIKQNKWPHKLNFD